MVISCFALSTTASKRISEPLELVCLRVIKLSTLASVRTVSSVFLTASSNAIVISELIATPVAEFCGVKLIDGGVVSAASKVADVAVMEFPEESSNVSPKAT